MADNEVDEVDRGFLISMGIILAVIVLGLLAFWLYSEVIDNPSQPIPSGDFPESPVWVFEGSGRVVSTPVVQGSNVFIRTMHSVYSLDGLTGHLLWRAISPAPAELSVAPLATHCCLIVPEEGSSIASFSITTGELLWRTPAIASNLRDSSIAWVEALASMNDLFAAARNDWKITAYIVENSEEVWERTVPNRSSLYLAANNDFVYLSAKSFLQAYDARAGNLIWEMNFDNNTGPLLLHNDRLYIALYSGERRIIALDPQTLNEVWNVKLSDIGDSEVRSMVVDGEILYAAANRLIAISKHDGSLRWKSGHTEWLETPVILHNTIYARNTGTDLFAFDKTNGLETGRLLIQADTAMKHEPERAPAVVGDLLLVPFGDNRVFAYKP